MLPVRGKINLMTQQNLMIRGFVLIEKTGFVLRLIITEIGWFIMNTGIDRNDQTFVR